MKAVCSWWFSKHTNAVLPKYDFKMKLVTIFAIAVVVHQINRILPLVTSVRLRFKKQLLWRYILYSKMHDAIFHSGRVAF